MSAALSFASATAKPAAPAPGKIENKELVHADWIDNCPTGVWFAPSKAPKAAAATGDGGEEEEKDGGGDQEESAEDKSKRLAAAAIAAAEQLQSPASTCAFGAHDMVAFTAFTSPCSRGTHYRMVNAKQWRLLAGWYGCDYTIPRLMTKDGNASLAKLEYSGFMLTVRLSST